MIFNRIFAAVFAWWNTLVLSLVIAWPSISAEPFPLVGYQNIVVGPALMALTFIAVCLAISVTVFWSQVRRHQWIFVFISISCFLYAALAVKVAIGFGFAALSMLIRSR